MHWLVKVLQLETKKNDQDKGWFIDANTSIIAIANWRKFVVSLMQNSLNILTKHTSNQIL